MRHVPIELLESRVLLNAADLDTTFGNGGTALTPFMDSAADGAGAIAIQSDGKLVAAGASQAYIGWGRLPVARYNANGSLDTTFGSQGTELFSLGQVFAASAIAVQSDGKIVISAETSGGLSHGQFAVLRLNSNGTLDTTFNGTGEEVFSLGGVDDAAFRMALQSDGKIILAGRTNDSQGLSHFALARLNANGGLDSTFGSGGIVTTTITPGGNDVILGLALDSSGRILAAGSSQASANASYSGTIVRYNANGTIDSTFGDSGVASLTISQNSYFVGIGVQSDGKIVAGGYSGPSSHTQFAAARFNSNGTVDSTFGTAGQTIISDTNSDYMRTLSLMSDGHIVMTGVTLPAGTVQYYNAMVARLTSTGAVDTSFNSTGMNTFQKSGVSAAAVHSDGTITTAGSAGPTIAASDISLIQFKPTGQVDTSFGTSGQVTTNIIQPIHAEADAVALQTNGDVVTAGYRSHVNPTPNPPYLSEVVLTRYNVEGQPDTSFGAGGEVTTAFGPSNDRANAIAIQPNGDILIAGQTTTASAGTQFLVARYLPNGTLDTSFGVNGFTTITGFVSGTPADAATAIALQSDGSILVAGDASYSGIGLARLTPSGQLDGSYGTGGEMFTPVYSIGSQVLLELDAQGRAVVAATTGSGYSNFVAARYTTSGKLDTTFGGTGQVQPAVPQMPTATSLSIGPDGKIVIGGNATSSAGAKEMVVARLNTDGSLDTTFGSGGSVLATALPSVSAVQVLSDGSIVVSAGAGGSVGLAQLLPSGALDPTFGAGGAMLTTLGGIVPQGDAMTIRPNGRIVVAGSGNNELMVSQFLGFPPLRVVSASYDYTHPQQSVSFVLSEDLPATPPLSSVIIANRNTSATVSPTQVTFDHTTHTLTFTFAAPLPDGNYQATLSGSITDASGNHLGGDTFSGANFVYNFFDLTADVNHDGTVNLADLLILTRNFGKAATYAQGDLNGDGTTNFADFLLLVRNFGHTVPTIPSAIAAAITPDSPDDLRRRRV